MSLMLSLTVTALPPDRLPPAPTGGFFVPNDQAFRLRPPPRVLTRRDIRACALIRLGVPGSPARMSLDAVLYRFLALLDGALLVRDPVTPPFLPRFGLDAAAAGLVALDAFTAPLAGLLPPLGLRFVPVPVAL